MPAKSKEELLAARAEREKAADVARERLELEELSLEDEHSAKGQRGKDFEIVVTALGCIVLRKPDFVVVKRFNAVASPSEEDVFQLVDPCVVHPAKDLVRAWFQEHGGVAWRCAAAVMRLYGAHGDVKLGKF